MIGKKQLIQDWIQLFCAVSPADTVSFPKNALLLLLLNIPAANQQAIIIN
jgi:hypothetical protein